MLTRAKALTAVAASSVLLAGSAYAETTGALAAVQASVIAINQKAKADAVSITYAFAPAEGKLAIYTADPTKRSAKPIGEVSLNPGDHRDVSVKLNEQPKSGTRLWAVVEQSKGNKPFRNLDGPAEQSFKVM